MLPDPALSSIPAPPFTITGGKKNSDHLARLKETYERQIETLRIKHEKQVRSQQDFIEQMRLKFEEQAAKIKELQGQANTLLNFKQQVEGQKSKIEKLKAEVTRQNLERKYFRDGLVNVQQALVSGNSDPAFLLQLVNLHLYANDKLNKGEGESVNG